ncbi:M24 family metallopeptidase [Ancylobacter sonchi]|uniref:M24 family metallopeptidase n=1 Tax=Ancylobacter sonchi TaxID=1937790 RepID=UPI001BD44982|nr:M24 family metallopeptidase [Ancylobacter sonchi]MBS7535427.1 M24 family metallopeptidase [Ancylobacter sonchi]
MPVFARGEYLARLARVKARMRERGLDVLVCADPASMNYLTGYDGWSFYVHQYVVVGLDREEPLWVGRAMDAPGARLTAFLGADSIRAYPESHVDSPRLHPAQFLAGVIADLGWGRAVVGVDLDAFYFTARAYLELGKALPAARLVDAELLVAWVRLVKSEAEIELMRGAAAIVSNAMTVGMQAVAPGVRECDAVAEITAAQFRGSAGFWGDYPAALANVPHGEKTAAPHLTWTGERYKHGEVAYLELGGCHARYHAALARTLYMGTPPAALLDVVKVVAEGMEVALDAARAGTTAHEVASVWNRVIARAGYEKPSRIGYSIGLNYPPDWGERTLSLREGEHAVLEENMCFHMILGMWMDDWGYELSETFRITASGAPEVLTDFPRELVIKP